MVCQKWGNGTDEGSSGEMVQLRLESARYNTVNLITVCEINKTFRVTWPCLDICIKFS